MRSDSRRSDDFWCEHTGELHGGHQLTGTERRSRDPCRLNRRYRRSPPADSVHRDLTVGVALVLAVTVDAEPVLNDGQHVQYSPLFSRTGDRALCLSCALKLPETARSVPAVYCEGARSGHFRLHWRSGSSRFLKEGRNQARFSTRRDGRVVDGGGLENHCTRKGTGGSNPSPSATLSCVGRRPSGRQFIRDVEP